ncbi:MAG: tetratricopeptide repeat protein [Pyrinomonadaceae bacterium]
MSLERKEIFEFGEFRLDVDEHTIERIDGHKNGTLTEKAFLALVLLVRRRGHLVSKDELIRFVWPDTIVEDNNLEKCVHHIRTFLGETNGTKYVETVRKHGYRFVGNVKAIEVSFSWLPETFRNFDDYNGSAAAPAIDQLMEPEAEAEKIVGTGSERIEKARYPFRSALMIPVIILALIGGLAGLGYYSFIRPNLAAADGRRSIAVLPLKPIDPANRNALYEIGVADSLISRLGQAKGLIIRSLSSVRKYGETEQDAVTTGLEQKVDYVLASNYQLADGKIRITSQLINVATGEVEEQYKSEKEASSTFAVQDAVADDFVGRLMARFNVVPAGPAKGWGTDNEEAYRLYLHGRHIYHRQMAVIDGLPAIGVLEQAVASDPNYARAWATLAMAYVLHSTSRIADGSEREKATDAAKKALALDPNLSDAYSAKCFVATIIEFDLGAAEGACKRALELDPNSGEAHILYGIVLSALGRHDEAISEKHAAIDIEPTSARYQRWLGNSLYFAHRFDEAEVQFKRCIEIDPRSNTNYESLMRLFASQGKESEAYEYLIKSLTVRGKDETTIERFRKAYKEDGWRGAVLERIRTSDHPRGFNIAGMYAVIGEKDKAFEWLEKAYELRDWGMIVVKVDPQLNSLRDDPRYDDLVRRIHK